MICQHASPHCLSNAIGLRQDTHMEDINEERFPRLFDNCTLAPTCAHLVHTVGGDQPGVVAVGLGSNLQKRQRAGRLAIAVRFAMLQEPAALEKRIVGHDWEHEFRKLLTHAMSIAIDPPPWGAMGYFFAVMPDDAYNGGKCLHVEHGKLEIGNAQPGWHSAMWTKADIGDGFFWLVNRWLHTNSESKSIRVLLHATSGTLEADVVDREKHAAMWKLFPSNGCQMATNRSSPGIRIALLPIQTELMSDAALVADVNLCSNEPRGN